MHAPRHPFAVRLIGFAPPERTQIRNALVQAPHAGPSYFCLLDDSLQEPDLYIANGDDPDGMAALAAAGPSPLQPAVVVGAAVAAAGFPRLARPLNMFQMYALLAELIEERTQALGLIAAGNPASLAERRRHARLDLCPGQPAAYACRRQAPPAGAVLIIDKGGAFRDHVAEVLSGRKLAVEWTDTAPAAVRLCDETLVSLVMINTSTPGIDPYALCSAIKAQGGASRTAVVFLVSRAFHYDSARARDAGVRGLLDQPVADRHLIAALKKLLTLPV